MEENRKLALIVSYYLSKFNRDALNHLGYHTFTEAFRDIGAKLNVKSSTIKNMREDFDPLHPNNGRVGWYQRELRPSRLNVVENYSHLSEMALTSIVQDILDNYPEATHNLSVYTTVLNNENDDGDSEEGNRNKRTYTTRGITGNQAEKLFIEAFNNGDINGYSGNLINTTNDGCGYDFELEGQNVVFEVKGLLDEIGGISLTDKEWNVANELGENYILVLISNIKDNPRINLYKNPRELLTAEKRTTKVIAINWTVSSNQLF